jgi:hypothetical protein
MAHEDNNSIDNNSTNEDDLTPENNLTYENDLQILDNSNNQDSSASVSSNPSSPIAINSNKNNVSFEIGSASISTTPQSLNNFDAPNASVKENKKQLPSYVLALREFTNYHKRTIERRRLAIKYIIKPLLEKGFITVEVYNKYFADYENTVVHNIFDIFAGDDNIDEDNFNEKVIFLYNLIIGHRKDGDYTNGFKELMTSLVCISKNLSEIRCLPAFDELYKISGTKIKNKAKVLKLFQNNFELLKKEYQQEKGAGILKCIISEPSFYDFVTNIISEPFQNFARYHIPIKQAADALDNIKLKAIEGALKEYNIKANTAKGEAERLLKEGAKTPKIKKAVSTIMNTNAGKIDPHFANLINNVLCAIKKSKLNYEQIKIASDLKFILIKLYFQTQETPGAYNTAEEKIRAAVLKLEQKNAKILAKSLTELLEGDSKEENNSEYFPDINNISRGSIHVSDNNNVENALAASAKTLSPSPLKKSINSADTEIKQHIINDLQVILFDLGLKDNPFRLLDQAAKNNLFRADGDFYDEVLKLIQSLKLELNDKKYALLSSYLKNINPDRRNKKNTVRLREIINKTNNVLSSDELDSDDEFDGKRISSTSQYSNISLDQSPLLTASPVTQKLENLLLDDTLSRNSTSSTTSSILPLVISDNKHLVLAARILKVLDYHIGNKRAGMELAKRFNDEIIQILNEADSDKVYINLILAVAGFTNKLNKQAVLTSSLAKDLYLAVVDLKSITVEGCNIEVKNLFNNSKLFSSKRFSSKNIDLKNISEPNNYINNIIIKRFTNYFSANKHLFNKKIYTESINQIACDIFTISADTDRCQLFKSIQDKLSQLNLSVASPIGEKAQHIFNCLFQKPADSAAVAILLARALKILEHHASTNPKHAKALSNLLNLKLLQIIANEKDPNIAHDKIIFAIVQSSIRIYRNINHKSKLADDLYKLACETPTIRIQGNLIEVKALFKKIRKEIPKTYAANVSGLIDNADELINNNIKNQIISTIESAKKSLHTENDKGKIELIKASILELPSDNHQQLLNVIQQKIIEFAEQDNFNEKKKHILLVNNLLEKISYIRLHNANQDDLCNQFCAKVVQIINGNDGLTERKKIHYQNLLERVLSVYLANLDNINATAILLQKVVADVPGNSNDVVAKKLISLVYKTVETTQVGASLQITNKKVCYSLANLQKRYPFLATESEIQLHADIEQPRTVINDYVLDCARNLFDEKEIGKNNNWRVRNNDKDKTKSLTLFTYINDIKQNNSAQPTQHLINTIKEQMASQSKQSTLTHFFRPNRFNVQREQASNFFKRITMKP